MIYKNLIIWFLFPLFLYAEDRIIIFYWSDSVSPEIHKKVFKILQDSFQECHDFPTQVVLHNKKNPEEINFSSFKDALLFLKYYKPSGSYIYESWDRLRRFWVYLNPKLPGVLKEHAIDSFLWDFNIVKTMMSHFKDYWNQLDIVKIFYIGLCPPSQPGKYFLDFNQRNIFSPLSLDEKEKLLDSFNLEEWKECSENMVWIITPPPSYWKMVFSNRDRYDIYASDIRNYWNDTCNKFYSHVNKNNVFAIK